MKKITYLLILSSVLLLAPLASADWIKEQQDLITNYQLFDSLKKSPLSKPESGLKKGKYESETEFNARLKKTRNKNVKRFYFENEANFNVPNDSSVINFPYSPFERFTISEDLSLEFGEGENAFGAKSTMMITRGTRQVFQAEEFDLKWPSTYTALSIDKEYLQKNSAEIVIIRIIDIDITDPASFEFDSDIKIARRDDLFPEDRIISETVLKGNVIAVGLYDKANKTTVGVFSSGYDNFYYSYNGQLDKLTEKENLPAEQKQVNPEITKKIKYKNVTTKQRKDKPESAQYIPVYVPQPQYPRRAQTRGKEGYAVILVTVTTTGGVRDPVMIEESPEGWGFGRAAVKAANKLKYNPFVIDGQAKEMSGVMYKFTFQMAR